MNPFFISVKLQTTLRGFLLFAFLFTLCFNSCAQMQVQDDFYLGLLSKSNDQDKAETVRHFEKALASSNVYIRQAAAEELAGLMYEGTELSPRTVERVKREAGGGWAAAFDAVGNTPDKDKVLSFLLGAGQDAVSNEARFFVLRECERRGGFFSEIESAAIEGRYASFRSRFNEALVFFRGFMEEGEWPQKIPALFLKYTDLISELGRTFQYTATGSEGIDLFLQWEKNLADESAAGPDSSVNMDEARYKLIFFAARNARRRGLTNEGVSLFESALALAPDGEQADACVWYIMDSSLSENFDVFIGRLEKCLPYLHDNSFIDDVLDSFLQALVSGQEWEKIIRTFAVIQNNSGSASTAACAWIIARAIDEGYLTDQQMRLAAEAANVNEADPSIFLRVAYNAGDSNDVPALYYRLHSASALDLPFLELPLTEDDSKSKNKPSPALQFLLGFFDYGASVFAPSYIRLLENDIASDELRSAAQALAKAGMYSQSIRLVTMYTGREGYIRDKRDIELLFPRYYSEPVEKYAAEYNIDPPVLYALIRTESAFQSEVISSAGAIGLTQLMPETAQEMADRIRRAGGPDYTSTEEDLDLRDPDLNVHIGSYYINYLMGRFDDILLSLLSYNGGMNRVRRWRDSSPLPMDLFLETIAFSETRDYGRRVIATAAVYQELYYR